MVIAKTLRDKNIHLLAKARNIKLVLSDNDGVMTDTGVYYSANGEEFKRFSIRDGLGVERLREVCHINTGIITGETSGSVRKRAEKLKITHLYLGAKKKHELFFEILKENNLKPENIAYIGDDLNDLEILRLCSLTACPSDAMIDIRHIVDYVCEHKGGNGAFREFAELIIALNTSD